MSLSYQDAVRNTRLNAITTALATTAYLEVFTAAGRQVRWRVQRRPGHEAGLAGHVQPRRQRRVGWPSDVQHDHLGRRPRVGHAGVVPIEDRGQRRPSTVIVEGDAAVGSGSLNFASAISSGGTVSISSATITEGNG